MRELIQQKRLDHQIPIHAGETWFCGIPKYVCLPRTSPLLPIQRVFQLLRSPVWPSVVHTFQQKKINFKFAVQVNDLGSLYLGSLEITFLSVIMYDIEVICFNKAKNGKRKVQGVPQSQTAALPRPQEGKPTYNITQRIDKTEGLNVLFSTATRFYN